MKASELKQLSADELRSKVQEVRAELWSARMKHETGQLENTAKLRSLRRDVARVQTVLRERLGATR
jgi:large subunit ribosomal protein L29